MEDPKAQLISALDQAIAVLAAAGETHWRQWLEVGRCKVLVDDASGPQHLLRAFGGMGSFNDLVLSPLNGHAGDEDTLRNSNDRLWDLRDSIWSACHSLPGECAS